MTQTDIYILSMRLFKRLKDVNTKNVSDLDAYAMIADWLFNMDASMNLASNINLTDLWTRIENYSIDTISLLMYTAYWRLCSMEHMLTGKESRTHKNRNYF